MRLCEIDGCGQPHRCKGLCESHYKKLRKWGDPLVAGKMGPKPKDPLERFWAMVNRVDDESCWPWIGGVSRGYGHFTLDSAGNGISAHRYSWILANGPVPEGMTLDHICHDPAICEGGTSCPHRACVNPAHLVVTTRAENTSRQRHRNAGKTHCIHGHEYTPENTGLHPDQRGRFCLTCARARKRAAYHARRAAS